MDQLFAVSTGDVAPTSDEWYTPRWIFSAARLIFDLDVAAPVSPEYRTCPARRYLTVLDDGLVTPWEGLVWCNPPYSRPSRWIDRWAGHPSGLLLVPASNSRWRQDVLRAADGITLISVNDKQGTDNGFGRPNGTKVGYPLSLILAARGPEAVSALPGVAAADRYGPGAYFVRPEAS